MRRPKRDKPVQPTAKTTAPEGDLLQKLALQLALQETKFQVLTASLAAIVRTMPAEQQACVLDAMPLAKKYVDEDSLDRARGHAAILQRFREEAELSFGFVESAIVDICDSPDRSTDGFYSDDE